MLADQNIRHIPSYLKSLTDQAIDADWNDNKILYKSLKKQIEIYKNKESQGQEWEVLF